MLGTIQAVVNHPEWWIQRLLVSILLIVGYWVITRILDKIIGRVHGLFKKFRPHSSSASSSYAAILQRVTRWAVGLSLLVFILGVWGANVSFLWTTVVGMLTLIGVGLLATWTMVSNVTARFFIWFWQPVRLGQRVEIFPENLCGRVCEENLMFTELRQDDGRIIIIPNNLFFQRVARRTPEEEEQKS